MTKLKKQTSKKKILHFFKSNQCVLFFHYDGNTKAYSTFIKQELCSQFQITSLFAKNKIADIVLTELFQNHIKNQGEKSKQLAAPIPINYSFNSKKLDNQDLVEPLKKNFNNQATGQKTDILYNKKALAFLKQEQEQEQEKQIKNQNNLFFKDFIFQGPIIFLGFQDLKSMQKVYNLCQNKNFIFCVAALYGMTILNHLQVERLAKLSNDLFLHSKLLQTSKEPLNKIVNLSRSSLNLHLLNSFKMRTITLLKMQIFQLSKKVINSA